MVDQEKVKNRKKNQPNIDNTNASDNLPKDKSIEDQTELENIGAKPGAKIKPTKKQTKSENVDINPEAKDDLKQKK